MMPATSVADASPWSGYSIAMRVRRSITSSRCRAPSSVTAYATSARR